MLPIAQHLPPDSEYLGERCTAEIDRLAVTREERGGLVAIGLMMLAYMHARAHGAERVFLDVFSEDKPQGRMYRKLGFTEVCRYHDPLEVTVMVLNQRLNYEIDEDRVTRFMRPMVTRLMKRIDFDPDEIAAIEQQTSQIVGTRVTQTGSVGRHTSDRV